MNYHWLDHLPGDGHPWRQRSAGVLKHHRNFGARRGPSCAVLAQKVTPVQPDAAGLRLCQPQNRAGNRGLSRPAFADQRHGLAAPDVKGNLSDRLDAVGSAAQGQREQTAAAVRDRKPIDRENRGPAHVHPTGRVCHRPGLIGQAIRHGRQAARRGGDARRIAPQKAPGIIVLRAGENLGHGTCLADVAVFHHQHLVAQGMDDAKVVGDKNHRRTGFRLQTPQQGQNLHLQRRIKRGRGFIGQNEVGLQHQGHRDRHPLPLPARQLVRIHPHPGLGIRQAYPIQRIHRPRPFLARGPEFAVQHIHHLLADGQPWRKRGQRVLRDIGNPAAAQRAQTVGGQAQKVLAVKPDVAGIQRRRLGQKPGQRPEEGRFPRTAFADDP